MTKILVSDYDKTLNFNGVSQSDIKQIERFVSSGNLFVVASSRNYPSLGAQMEEFNIPYSYLSCNNANCIFDSSGNLLSVNYLTEEEKQLIKKLGIDPRIINPKNAYGNDEAKNILYYYIMLSKGQEFENEILPLIKDLDIENDYWANMGYLFSSKRQKDFAGEFIRQRHQVTSERVYTIGDGANDVSMLSRFNGYTFPWGVNEAKENALGEVESVGEFIELIESDKPLVRKRVL